MLRNFRHPLAIRETRLVMKAPVDKLDPYGTSKESYYVALEEADKATVP